MAYHQQQKSKVKVTHSLSKATHEAVSSLVTQGKARDVSSFIEAALQQALLNRQLDHLKLELEAFDDPGYHAEIAALGNSGLEDLQEFLGDPQ